MRIRFCPGGVKGCTAPAGGDDTGVLSMVRFGDTPLTVTGVLSMVRFGDAPLTVRESGVGALGDGVVLAITADGGRALGAPPASIPGATPESLVPSIVRSNIFPRR